MKATLILPVVFIASSALALVAVVYWEAPTAAIASNFMFPPIGDSIIPVSKLDPQAANEQIMARPLFSSTRRPAPPVAPPAQMEPPTSAPAIPSFEDVPDAKVAVSPRLKLLGTEHGAHTLAALISSEDGTVREWVNEGDVFSGWRVTEIRRETVRLAKDTNDGENFVLSLYPEPK
ncbi:hypothetical protein [Rhizobium sp. PP-CC-3G-465]|uniref:hypothetical protein n=1 Tax=Rhizobium sp. PP-CC-3G-465 TaxID=2135648 RepID=UPI00104B4873